MTLAARLARALAVPADRLSLLPGDLGPGQDAGDARPAAVLVGVVDRPEPTLLLTQRTEHLRKHAGQIAFPGGGIDPEDADPTAAALREAEEEIGLDPAHVRVIGETDRYLTRTGFAITPIVGIVEPDLLFVPHDVEVAAVFEVPLAFVADAGNQLERELLFEGRQRRYFDIQWQDRRIWGVTAAMIVNFARRLAAAA